MLICGEFPFDLSKAVFITTANSLDTIPAPLLDRMEVISLDGYTREEKFNIAKRHLISKQLKSHALKTSQCKIADDAVFSLIDFYTREAGVRKLERAVASLCRKAAKKIASGETKNVTIKASMLEELLGKKKYRIEAILPQDETGIINGLAWTAVGGEIMQLEVAVLEGTGKTVLTGSLGDVMKESAEAAITFVRMNAKKYGIDPFFYRTKDIHIHATEFDISMLKLLNHFKIPYMIVLTKCDKLNKTEFNDRLEKINEELGFLGKNKKIVPFSALKNIGTEDIRAEIDNAILN